MLNMTAIGELYNCRGDHSESTNLLVCRICLVFNVKMYELCNKTLQKCYEEVLGSKFDIYNDGLLQQVCYECSYLLKKYYKFKLKCLHGQNLLNSIVSSMGKLSSEAVFRINRQVENLTSSISLSCDSSTIAVIDIKKELDDEITVKDEDKLLYDNSEDDNFVDLSDQTEIYEKQSISSVKDETYSENIEIQVNDKANFTVINKSIQNPEIIHFQSTGKKVKSRRKKSNKHKPKNPEVILLKSRNFKRHHDFDDNYLLSDDKGFSDDSDDMVISQIKARASVKNEKPQLLKTESESAADTSIISKPSPAKRSKSKKCNDGDTSVCYPEGPRKKNIGLCKYNINEEDWEILTLTKEEQLAKFNDPLAVKSYRAMKYFCDICHRGFFKKTGYDDHNFRHDENFGSFECWLCKSRYKSKALIQVHLLKHERMYKCKRCGYKADVIYSVKRHDEVHRGKKLLAFCPLFCKLCNLSFRVQSSYDFHMQNCHMVDFLCAVCGSNFESGEQRTVHMKELHHEDPDNPENDSPFETSQYWVCAECDVRFRSEAAHRRHLDTAYKHSRTLSNQSRDEVKVRKSFIRTRRTDLSEEDWNIKELTEKEMEEEHRVRLDANLKLNYPFQCSICQRGFAKKNVLDSHKKIHEREGRYECKLCCYRFKAISFLKGHNRTRHSYRFECKRCPFVTILRNHAAKHDHFHKGLRFTCTLCNLTFAKENSLRTHLRWKHRSEFICDLCGDNFLSEVGLEAHKKLTHAGEEQLSDEGEVIECSGCGMRFRNEAAYEVHFSTSSRHAAAAPPGQDKNFKGKLPNDPAVKRTVKPPRYYPKKPGSRPYGNSAIKCDECEKVIPDYKYAKHCKLEHPGTPIKKNVICELCGFMTSSNVSLTAHKQLKHTEGEHPCAECGKNFKTKAALSRHILIHRDNKKHCCPVCGKTFVQSCNMKAHYERIHLRKPQPKRVRRKTPHPHPHPQAHTHPHALANPFSVESHYEDY